MGTKNVLAFDMGASSGRGILCRFDGEKAMLDEVHRFIHNFSTLNGHAYWNILSIMDEIKKGLRKSEGQISGIGFDTWGVDCGFLTKNGDLISMPGSYRDACLDEKNMFEALEELDEYLAEKGGKDDIFPPGEKAAFSRTGIACLAYNTAYKLYYMKKNMPDIMEKTDKILMMPNLMEYFMSGVKHTEYSIGSTTQLFDMKNRCWSADMIKGLNLSKNWFTEVEYAGKDLGPIKTDISGEIQKKDIHVISVPGHDTACAVAAVPAKEKEFTFLSCGTWSLMGLSLKNMLTGDKVIKDKISNEGTADGGYRPTVNIIGMWIQNELRRNLASEGHEYSFKELETLALKEKPLQSFIRPDDFMQPGDYPKKIREYCKNTGQPVPQTVGALVRCILESLAMKYKQVYMSLKPYITWEEKLYMVGGGVQNRLMTEFTASALGIPVVLGTSEATTVGNVMTQLKTLGEYKTDAEKCDILSKSFESREIMPTDTDIWNEAYERFERLTN